MELKWSSYYLSAKIERASLETASYWLTTTHELFLKKNPWENNEPLIGS